MGTTVDLSYGLGPQVGPQADIGRMRESTDLYHSDAPARKTGADTLKVVPKSSAFGPISLGCCHWMYFVTCISPYDLCNHVLSTISYFNPPRKFPMPLPNLHSPPRSNHHLCYFPSQINFVSIFHMNTCYFIKQDSRILKSILSQEKLGFASQLLP